MYEWSRYCNAYATPILLSCEAAGLQDHGAIEDEPKWFRQIGVCYEKLHMIDRWFIQSPATFSFKVPADIIQTVPKDVKPSDMSGNL